MSIIFLADKYYLGVAQFGSVLEWGSRGRRFESSHPDAGSDETSDPFFVLGIIALPLGLQLWGRSVLRKPAAHGMSWSMLPFLP